MKDIFTKIHDMEKDNYRTLIESLENDNYVIENNMNEMEANINLLTASSNMSYATDEEQLDSAFSDGQVGTPEPVVAAPEQTSPVDDDVDVYGERANEDYEDDEDEDDGFEDDDEDDFLDE